MIESSITEEIKEENYSDKTSSDNKSNSQRPQDKSGSHAISSEDHVIVREGVTSIFAHNNQSSRGDTEAGESGGSGTGLATTPPLGAGSDL